MTVIDVFGTYNVRDLGGYKTEDGHRTKSHTLIRAGNLDKLPEASQQQLIAYGIKTVIDIRDEWEVAHYPNAFADSPHVTYLNIPLLGDALSNDDAWQKDTADYDRLSDLYITYLEGCKRQIAAILTTIANQDMPTVFHCHAGKDRTGIIAALLLSMSGVSVEDIATDYSLSDQHIQHLITEWRQYAVANGQDMEEFARKTASRPETMVEMMDYLNRTYGSTRDYLRSCGISDVVIDTIKVALSE